MNQLSRRDLLVGAMAAGFVGWVESGLGRRAPSGPATVVRVPGPARGELYAGVEQLTPRAVRVDCGTSDAFFRATQLFVARLPRGHQGSFEPGGHETGYWRAIAPGQMATIAAAFQR